MLWVFEMAKSFPVVFFVIPCCFYFPWSSRQILPSLPPWTCVMDIIASTWNVVLSHLKHTVVKDRKAQSCAAWDIVCLLNILSSLIEACEKLLGKIMKKKALTDSVVIN